MNASINDVQQILQLHTRLEWKKFFQDIANETK